jgi:hypothetical protein
MGVAGREILRWLAQQHILQTARAPFEALLLEIAEYAEEWLTSAQAMGHAERMVSGRVMPWDRRNLAGIVRPAAAPGRVPPPRFRPSGATLSNGRGPVAP